jgi:hypothetical protein
MPLWRYQDSVYLHPEPALTYQPQWENGVELAPGTRESARRYEAIRPALERVEPFTLLDLGANDGYFSLRAAEDFDGLIAAVDKVPIQAFHPKITQLRQTVTARNLANLGRFDVVLALSVMHHFDDWRTALYRLRQMARRAVIVEVPHPDEELLRVPARHELAELHQAVSALSVGCLGTSPATRQPELDREIHLLPPLVVGTPFAGSGTHGRWQRNHSDEFAAALGYTPYPGSLNLRIGHTPDFTPDFEILIGTRDYQIHKARIPQGVPVHMMIPGGRAWPNSVELLSPVYLRDIIGEKVEVELL